MAALTSDDVTGTEETEGILPGILAVSIGVAAFAWVAAATCLSLMIASSPFNLNSNSVDFTSSADESFRSASSASMAAFSFMDGRPPVCFLTGPLFGTSTSSSDSEYSSSLSDSSFLIPLLLPGCIGCTLHIIYY